MRVLPCPLVTGDKYHRHERKENSTVAPFFRKKWGKIFWKSVFMPLSETPENGTLQTAQYETREKLLILWK